MPFRISPSKTFAWPVKVAFASETKAGEVEEMEFVAHFKRINAKADVTALLKRAGNEDAIMANEVLLGWEGIEDEDGNPLEYSEENKAKLLEGSYDLAAACVVTFQEATLEVTKKNLKT